MGYKHVTIVVQDKWLESLRKLGIEPIDDLLRRFLRVPEWHWLLLKQSPNGCVVLVKSELLNEKILREAIEEDFRIHFLVAPDQFPDLVALKFEDLGIDAALALEKKLLAENKAKAARTPAQESLAKDKKLGIDFEEIFRKLDKEWNEDCPIDELNLSVRTYNCLMRGGATTIGKLTSYSKAGLSKFRNMSQKSVEEIELTLAEWGLQLAADDTQPLPLASEAEDAQKSEPDDDWIGGKAFVELIAEFKKVAPVIKDSETQEVFAAQSYLFAINDGYGLTSWLARLTHALGRLGFHPGNPESIREYLLPLGLEEQDIYSTWKDFMATLGADFGECGNSLIICLDICEWLPRLNEVRFRSSLRQLEKYIGKVIFVFRVPFLEKDALDNVYRVLSDVLTIRRVSFPPFSTAELLQCTRKMLRGYGFALTDEAVPVLTARISEEKRDGRFYGIKTLKKISREMVYLKQLSFAEGKNQNRNAIASGDILKLSESYQATNKSGMDQLNELVGLTDLKQQILEILTQIETGRKHKKRMPCIHMRFTGNPGTGKTTVARILGKILSEKGILRNGSFFEYSGRDFCGRYVGQTAPKTAAMCRDAYGSVLFIDEAYSLYRGDGYDGYDYGKEALVTLIAEMENHRDDMLVIMAGYSDEMENLMKGNTGLKSRMPYTLAFPNYTRDELATIFMGMAQGEFTCDEDLKAEVEKYFRALTEEALNDKAFSNARFVRNLYERTWCKASLRQDLSDNAQEIILKAEDFRQAASEGEFKSMLEKKRRGIGFGV